MKTFLNLPRLGALIGLCTALSAHAHTGHGTHSLMQGLSHPFGSDHLLAMVAVGVWSVSALPTRQAWQGPATFMLALVLNALLGMWGVTVPLLEHAIALSVVLFGAMLVFASRPFPKVWGLSLIAVAASLHGLAHGAETPETGFAAYAAGFLLTTAALHTGGVGIGLGLRRWLSERNHLAMGGMGAVMAGAGLYLFTQV